MDPLRKTSRREFLKGRSASGSLADAVLKSETVPDGMVRSSRQQSDGRPLVVQIGRRAMACQFEVFLNAGQYEHGNEAAIEALDLVDELEAQMTVFRDDSEISQINQLAAYEPVEVEPRLFELLQVALHLAEETLGALDITAAPLSKLWGFHRRAGAMPQEADLAETLEQVGSHHVHLDETSHTVRFLTEGVELNLGSIGKGYALDRCAELLRAAGIENFLLHGGQSSLLARGSRADAVDGESGFWKVGVRHPLRPEKPMAELRLRNRALATSGNAAQSFFYKGKRYGHILDPRSGRPVEGMLSSTAIAPNAALADALATAFYVMGFEQALEFCRAQDQIAAILVRPKGRSGNAQIEIFGLDQDEVTIYK